MHPFKPAVAKRLIALLAAVMLLAARSVTRAVDTASTRAEVKAVKALSPHVKKAPDRSPANVDAYRTWFEVE